MRTRRSTLRLGEGSRIAIVGGGPSGALFAHFAAKLAASQGLRVEIVVFDGKIFARKGPAGCNMGAGVVSESLTRLLLAEGIEPPTERIQRHIRGYRLYTRDSVLDLPEISTAGEISSVYRGSGPRFSAFSYDVSFDDFLLRHVVEEAPGSIQVIPEPVDELVPPQRPGARMVLRYGRGKPRQEYEADLVVGAFGLNTSMLQKVTALGFGYRPPPTVRAFQAEFPIDPDHIRDVLGDRVHTFALGLDGIRFGALTPKKEHVTVSVVGKTDLGLDDLTRFLSHPAVRSVLPIEWVLPDRFCFCLPRLSLGAATRPFADRMVLIGDSAYCRFYKNGFESAFITARLAAESAFGRGIGAEDFASGYYRQAMPLIRDNTYGHLLFGLNDLVARHAFLAETHRRLIHGRPGDRSAVLLREILWGMLTGCIPYQQILRKALSPRLVASAVTTMAGVVLGRAQRPATEALGWRV
jgi:flavin-dependent dehydrogenase